jgi:hypothetical protein
MPAMKGYNLRLDEPMREDLETIRKRQRYEVPLSSIVRRALLEFIDRELGDDPERKTQPDTE